MRWKRMVINKVDGVEGANGMLFFYGVMIGPRHTLTGNGEGSLRRLGFWKNDPDSGETRGHESFLGACQASKP